MVGRGEDVSGVTLIVLSFENLSGDPERDDLFVPVDPRGISTERIPDSKLFSCVANDCHIYDVDDLHFGSIAFWRRSGHQPASRARICARSDAPPRLVRRASRHAGVWLPSASE